MLLRGDWNIIITVIIIITLLYTEFEKFTLIYIEAETISEENSNFYRLLNLRAQENREIIDWLRKRDEKYISQEIRNELLEAMALDMMRQISANIQNVTFFTIMADETADVSNKEQLVICIWWVEDCFVKHEDFIGIHPLERIHLPRMWQSLTERSD